MAFYPDSFKDCDFSKLPTVQARALANWMGAMREYARYKGGKENDFANRVFLKQRCEQNADRAQQGYDVIVRGKSPKPDAAIPADVEKRLYAILTETMDGRDVQIEEGIRTRFQNAIAEFKAEQHKVLAANAKQALKDAAENARPIVIKDGSKVRKVKGVLPPEFERMVQLASARIPMLLVGPAGCGKTYLCEKLAEALGLDFSDQSCSEGMSESVFNGLLLPIGKSGAFEHVPSPFMTRYENGGAMLLDEMDAGDSNLFTYINKAIANSSYTVPQRWHNPVVKKHPDFVLVAAANTFGHGADSMYVGRNQLDAATLDRFKVGLIQMDYCKEVEKSLAPDDLCEWAWRIRESIRVNKLRRVMSTRVIKDLATMTERYSWKRQDWDNAYFTGWSPEDRRMVA